MDIYTNLTAFAGERAEMKTRRWFAANFALLVHLKTQKNRPLINALVIAQ